MPARLRLELDGVLSLREAVQITNTNGEADTITFSVSGTITLLVSSGGTPTLTATGTTIDGTGHTITVSRAASTADGLSLGGSVSLTLENSIVAGGGTNGDVLLAGGATAIGSNSVIGDGSGVGTFFTNSLAGNPGLAPLADNGGPTMTHALLPGSIARNAGNAGLLPPRTDFDQRGPGFTRVALGGLDIGAFEVQVPAPPAPPTPPALDAAGNGASAVSSGAVTAGAGFGVSPHVKVFRAGDLAEMASFAFDPNYLGGADVAAGDGRIVTGSFTNASHVKAFDLTGAELMSLLAFPGFSGGVRVGFGDADGDGVGDALAGAGPGAGPHMKAFEPFGSELVSLFGAPVDFTGGVEPA